MNRGSVLVWAAVVAATFAAGCTTAPRAAEPRTPPPRPPDRSVDSAPRNPPVAERPPAPDAGRPAPAPAPAPGRRPPPSQSGACASSQQCPQGQYCTTEDGACGRPPGCGPNDICPMVCYGKCATKGAAKGRVRCGKKLCLAGQICCNESCGICTAPDGFCTKQLCGEPGGPKAR